MSDGFKVGVVGAGVFAGYHANKIVAHARSTLIGVFDETKEKAVELAKSHSVTAYTELSALAEDVDALVIATPASRHAAAAMIGINAGCALLIEKPLSPHPDDAKAIVDRCAALGLTLQVGHQERIVADVIGLPHISAKPEQIRIRRHMPRTVRNLDTSVVMDLMVHDLDLLHSLYGVPDWISTETRRSIYSETLDTVVAELGYPGMVAYVSASRDAEAERRWTLQYAEGTIDIDFAAKTLRHDTEFELNADFGSRPEVEDNLGTAWDRFVRAYLDGDAPLASGADGLAAVRMAATIEGTS